MGSEVLVGAGFSAGTQEMGAAGNGWAEGDPVPNGESWGVQAGGEEAESRALGTPGLCGSEDQAKGVRSCLDLPRWRPLVLAATLPAMLASWRWGGECFTSGNVSCSASSS